VIKTNLPSILHRFRDIALDRSKIGIFGCPSCVYTLDRGVPLDDLRKIVHECHWIAKVPNGVEIAEIFNRLSRVHERYRQTDRRQTDGEATAYSERERESSRSLKISAF